MSRGVRSQDLRAADHDRAMDLERSNFKALHKGDFLCKWMPDSWSSAAKAVDLNKQCVPPTPRNPRAFRETLMGGVPEPEFPIF